MATKKVTEATSKIKAAAKSVAEKTADTVKKAKTATKATAKTVEAEVKAAKAKVSDAVATKKTAVKKSAKATVSSLKEAEEKAEKVVAKVKAAKSATKTAAKAATKTAVKKVATKATAAKTAAKTAVAKAATKATAKVAKVAEAVDEKVAAKVAVKASKKDENIASLAQSFDAEYLVIMQKDPNWMHAFWEVSEDRIQKAKKGKGKLVLRLFDISSDLTVQRSKKRKFRDVEVPANARSWYVENTAGKAVVAVLGSVQGKNFMPIVESAPVEVFDKTAAAPASDDAFAKASLGGNTLGNFMSSGFSSQTAESWLKSLGENAGFGSSSESMFSGALSSAALQSNATLAAASKDSVNYGKDFFLWVKTRLIVYGGTRPDAHLQVRGEDFPLNPDGTFSFEEDLPDCTKVIPVFATDKDGDFPTTIVPIVVKRTE
ncbi:MAG: DUF4912 domain-containing protein [Fibrobacter sp.]|nr:DUF4912 domain-containing protein [Fibrobacter sp.]